ncbi:MAG TPA: FKBP-type peptidyl-prolyl cis-trans isomerase [Candidatus Acidoferrales bacterium]|nr:FKBP-type peptidyl-prolyl cis-trans isomerase [Candidatus Acidoferrales bacterium]
MEKNIVAPWLILAAALVAQNAPAQQTQAPAAGAPSSKTPAAKTTPQPATKSSTAASPALTTDREKQSYALGMNIARGLKGQLVDVDPAVLTRAIKDVLSGAKPLLTDEEAMDELKKLQAEVRDKQEVQRKELGDKNLKEGQEFLAANKTKPGVVTLPSGLQYKILTQGTGPKPKASETVVCQYRGTLIDGTEFDSSYKRGQAATFPVNRVIRGWTEALELMPVGSKWQLFIPSDLAYGDRGAGNLIGPNATLIFEVELMSIQAPNSAPPPQNGTKTNP